MSENKQFDAAKVSSKTHKVLFENDKVRVLEVTIQPGEKEPIHTHPYKSITIIEKPSRLKYYDEQGNLINEIEVEGVSWLEPVGLHSAENVGNSEFKGYRVEMK
jgi:quercetin dioxygenase-like cupin family protein